MINSIKEKIIKDFIKENYRSPSQQEIKTFYNSFISNNKSAESTGILKTSVGLGIFYALMTRGGDAAGLVDQREPTTKGKRYEAA